MTVVLPPGGLCSLVESYAGKQQAPVRFRVPSWESALADSQIGVTELLRDDRYTESCTSERWRRAGDRTVTRVAIRSACEATDLDDADQVLRAFVLVMAWGSGTSGTRGLRNTVSAVSCPDTAHKVLSNAAQALRRSKSISDHSLESVHAAFALTGVRQAFFTKWFSFAGHVPGRTWQPLILDSRVYATLNDTLGVTTISMAGTRNRAARYAAYIGHLHQWAGSLTAEGCAVDAERLEWIFFAHNGRPLPPACT